MPKAKKKALLAIINTYAILKLKNEVIFEFKRYRKYAYSKWSVTQAN